MRSDPLTVRTWAVILTHNRPTLLPRAVDAAAPQMDRVVVVDNASNPPATPTWATPGVDLVVDPGQPPNLGRLWNSQLDRIEQAEYAAGAAAWNVALLCDDVVLPPRWAVTVAAGLRGLDAAAASTHSYNPVAGAYRLTELTNGPDRMCPWAFMLPGERGLRADPSMAFWYVDTDLDWRARLSGGTVIVPGPVAPNLEVGYWTAAKPELGAQAHRDRAAFSAKWGGRV